MTIPMTIRIILQKQKEIKKYDNGQCLVPCLDDHDHTKDDTHICYQHTCPCFSFGQYIMCTYNKGWYTQYQQPYYQTHIIYSCSHKSSNSSQRSTQHRNLSQTRCLQSAKMIKVFENIIGKDTSSSYYHCQTIKYNQQDISDPGCISMMSQFGQTRV